MTAVTDVTLPTEKEIALAHQGQRTLAASLTTSTYVQRIQIFDAKDQPHVVELPTSALRLLVDILAVLAEGSAVRVVPVHAELTTQEAADLLNVSRPHFVKLLESHALPHHKTGKHRRIKFADLAKFKAERDRKSEEALEALAAEARAMKMGYE